MEEPVDIYVPDLEPWSYASSRYVEIGRWPAGEEQHAAREVGLRRPEERHPVP